MRNMSFTMTTRQIKNRSTTMTRRFGWWFLKPGDRIQAVEKGMGLKKGEKVKKKMEEHYGKEKGEDVFYASERSGKIKGVKKKSHKKG